MELTTGIKDLYQRLQAIEKIHKVSDDIELLEVDDIASKLATVYEKIRNTVDYKEEHLLRRFAIERELRRRVMLDTLQPKMARALIEGLIRGKYLPNKELPISIVDDVEHIIHKYQLLLFHVNSRSQGAKNKRAYTDWITSMAAVELDMLLSPEYTGDALTESLYDYVKERCKIKGDGLSIREKNIQLYIVIHKDLLLSDNASISYELFQLYFPAWSGTEVNEQLIEYVADKFPSIYLGIQGHITNPHQTKIKKALKKELAMFKVLMKMIKEHGDITDLLADPDKFKDEAIKTLGNINKKIRRKITRRSLRAIIYIFLTKMVLAFILEYPYDVYIVGHVNEVALATNVLFPPFLMFAVALTARMPGISSSTAIVDGLMSYVYGEPETHTLLLLKGDKQKPSSLRNVLYVLYLALYGIVFGFIIYWLMQFGFNWLSIALFIFFVTVVSFFAMRLRELAKEYNVIQTRPGVIVFLLNFFSLPIVKLGHSLSANMQRINIFIFLFDFILEAPFKLFVEAFEGLVSFLGEKRDEIYKE